MTNDIPFYKYNGLYEVAMLKHIITTSRDILFGQIDHYKIEINNEADLQLHFSYILKSVGELFKFGINHNLKIISKPHSDLQILYQKVVLIDQKLI
ncbi:hypothetical protein BK143_10985 [Paenibacillus peoriae]|nr:hypothetical protein BK143_10985 [Paenibacillus peoriae]